jgi:threonine/homoserine efflux transporter RhtA
MISFPKPRGFWDYELFALFLTCLLMLMFWLDASDAVDWTDAALALLAAELFVFAVVLARRNERAKWIARRTGYVGLLTILGAVGFIFCATYADTYLFHRRDLTSSRLHHDIALAIFLTAALLWSLLRRRPVATPG